MKILNCYAGIGGNRKLWGDEHEITSIELDPQIAEIYKHFFPNDNVIVGNAHEYLLKHYKEFDFIWSSPPCPSHSDIRRCGVHKGQYDAIYPEMSLYQEIILLQNFARKDTQWVIENVKPYYDPLIKGKLIHRHLFWSSKPLLDFKVNDKRKHSDIEANSTVYGFYIKKFKADNKRKILRNMVNPEVALNVFNQLTLSKKDYNKTIKQMELFND